MSDRWMILSPKSQDMSRSPKSQDMSRSPMIEPYYAKRPNCQPILHSLIAHSPQARGNPLSIAKSVEGDQTNHIWSLEKSRQGMGISGGMNQLDSLSVSTWL
jgi:hypothetical protein